MRTNSMVKRPLTLAAACAPVSVVPFRAVPIAVISDSVADHTIAWRGVSADAPQLPQVHQIRVQAELAQGAVHASGSYGTNGSTVNGTEMSAKKRLFVARGGVPPRGRPV